MPVKFSLPIADIQVPGKRKKTLEPDKVSALAEDMLENGQTTPISVRSAKDGYVEGYHRLEALRALGEKTVVAFEVRARLH